MGIACLCVACALNEMNACAKPVPNCREWRGEISDIMDRGVVTKTGQGKRMMFGEKDERGE